MRKSVIISSLLLCVLAVVAACNRRPLEDMMEKILLKVTINLDGVSNVTCDIYNPEVQIPNTNTDMLRVMVYDRNTHALITQSFISEKSVDEQGHQVISGLLNISYGNYDFLVYNFDTPSTLIRNENNEDEILAYTSEMPASAAAHYAGGSSYSGTISYQPDHLMVSRDQDYRISPHDELTVVETTAYTVIDTYYIQIHVEGLQFASSATAVISGLSPSNKIGPNERTTSPSTAVAFDLVKSTDKNMAGDNKDVLCAVFNTFGKLEDASSDLIVTFNVVDTAGNLLQKEVNLNQVFRTEDAIEHHWLLIDETWTIVDPTPVKPQSGGFQPLVDDWEEVNGEIIL
jgi:hypothetical protein